MSSTIRQLLREKVWCTEPRVTWISVTLLAATVGVFASGIPCTFPLYVGFLKSFFNSTHSQVSFITGAYAIGEGFHIPAAILESQMGPRWTMLVAAVLNSSGFVLLYLSFVLPPMRKISFVVIGLVVFLISNGRSYTFIGAFACAIRDTPTPHRAKLVGFLDMVFELGALMQILFFYHVFHGNDLHSSDIANFTIFSLCMTAVCLLLCGPFLVNKELSIVDESESKDTAEESALKSKDTAEESPLKSNDTAEETAVLKSNTAVRLQSLNKSSTFKFLFSAEFLLLNFSMSLPIALSHVFFYNTVHFTESLDLGFINQTLLTVFKAGVISFRILAGITMDRFRRSLMIYGIILAVCIQTVTGQALSLLSLYVTGNIQIAFLIIGYLTSGITIGAMYLFTPILLSDICGLPKIARNVAIVYSCGTILNVIIQAVYGELYDSIKMKPADQLNETLPSKTDTPFVLYDDNTSIPVLYCKGSDCVRPTLLLTTSLSMAALVMFVILALRLHDKLTCAGPTKTEQEHLRLENIPYDPVPQKDPVQDTVDQNLVDAKINL